MRNVPKKYIGLYNKRNTSRKAAIRSFCLECMGYKTVEVKNCTDPGCPLYHWRLKGGGSNPIRQTAIPTKVYAEWRKNILERDGHKCKICGLKVDLEVHHIVRVVDEIELIVDQDNGISLCRSCHHKIHAGKLVVADFDCDKVNENECEEIR